MLKQFQWHRNQCAVLLRYANLSDGLQVSGLQGNRFLCYQSGSLAQSGKGMMITMPGHIRLDSLDHPKYKSAFVLGDHLYRCKN